MAEYNTYKNMKILHNTPEHFVKYCVDLWEKTKEVVISKSEPNNYLYYAEDEFIQYIGFESNELKEFIKDIFNVDAWGVMWVTSWPNAGMDHIHADRTRNVGINIPIAVDFDNSCFFIESANQKCTEIPSKKGRRFKYEPERYDWYNIRKPTIINADAPHGYFNHSNTRRVLLSITVNGKYEEVLAKLPPSLYTD